MLHSLPGLRVLDIAGCYIRHMWSEIAARGIQQMTSLRSLNLANDVSQSQDFWKHLAKCLPSLQELQTLILSNNELLDDDVSDLSRAFCEMPNLQQLFLDCCRLRCISNELSEALGKLCSMQALSMCCNGLGLADVKLLAKSCTTLQLTSLDLFSNSFGADGCNVLLGLVSSIPTLVRLSLSLEDVSRSLRAPFEAAEMHEGTVWWDHCPVHLGQLPHDESDDDGSQSVASDDS